MHRWSVSWAERFLSHIFIATNQEVVVFTIQKLKGITQLWLYAFESCFLGGHEAQVWTCILQMYLMTQMNPMQFI